MAILFQVKPEWYDKSKAKKDKPKPIPHKGISQKIKEGIPLSKREKAAVGYVQLIMTLSSSSGYHCSLRNCRGYHGLNANSL